MLKKGEYMNKNITGKAYTEGTWKHNATGWWYQHANGSYTKNNWEKINGKWYYFNANGYMVTGWKQISGKWYFFLSNGHMVSNTSKVINGKTYKFDKNGVCLNP